MKMLIVDDEPLVARYIVQCIQEADPECIITGVASSGAKALQSIQETKPDMVFTDITMPKMDGLELLQEIKARYSNIKVVILTCHNDFDFAREAIRYRAEDYILKSEVSPVLIRQTFDKLFFEAVSDAVSSPRKGYSEPIEKAIIYIHRNYQKDLSLRCVAEYVFLNSEYFSRRFKQEVGVKFSEYLMNFRLQKAKNLLESGNMQTGEIAVQVGIDNFSYFTSAFKKKYGMTPGEARKKYKE